MNAYHFEFKVNGYKYSEWAYGERQRQEIIAFIESNKATDIKWSIH